VTRALAVLAAVAALLGCARQESTLAPVTAAPPAPIAISSVHVAREEVAEVVTGTGSIVADKATQIGPRVSGLLEAVHVDVGGAVEPGEPLFTVRQIDYRLRLAEAEQALRLARAEEENARRRLERARQLFGEGVTSQGALDDARTAFEIASARAGSAASTHAIAKQALADTVVRAPYAGVVTARYFDEGAMLSAQVSSPPVVELMKTDRVEAVVQIPEAHLARVRVGSRARVHVDGALATHETTVAVVNDRVDATTRAFEARLALDNPDGTLKPGLFVRVEILPEPREALVVPRSALQGDESERYVFVAADERARRRDVTTRDLDAMRVEVRSGLREGERVLLGPNLARLREGAAIALEVARVDR
jgi:RND family efflux transporter MFP subunit